MSDIVKRLNDEANLAVNIPDFPAYIALYREAAAEIERLRALAKKAEAKANFYLAASAEELTRFQVANERAEKAEAELAAIKSGDMVLVPREPTPAMIEAGAKGVPLDPEGSDFEQREAARDAYDYMIEAWEKEAGE